MQVSSYDKTYLGMSGKLRLPTSRDWRELTYTVSVDGNREQVEKVLGNIEELIYETHSDNDVGRLGFDSCYWNLAIYGV